MDENGSFYVVLVQIVVLDKLLLVRCLSVLPQDGGFCQVVGMDAFGCNDRSVLLEGLLQYRTVPQSGRNIKQRLDR